MIAILDPSAWAELERDLAGYVVVGGWRGRIAKQPVTAIVVAGAGEHRLVYYDHRARALRSVPYAEGVLDDGPPVPDSVVTR